MKTFTIILFILLYSTSFSTIIKVGQNKQFTLPSQALTSAAVQDGDTVEIDSGTYTGDVCIWKKNNLLVRGVGGYAHLAAGGKNAVGKAIWVVEGNDNIIENIEFSDCTVPDKNGAGIRFEGKNLTIRHCYFHDNEDGILTGANDSSDIIIEQSEFARNGYGDGQSHNLYIGKVRSLTFRFNYSHHAKIGHNLKSRAKTNYILYNRIMDEETGNSSMLIDLPNGGRSFIIGNLLMQGPNAENRKLISYGAEELSNPDSVLYVINNTMVNKRSAGATFVYIEPGTKEAKIINNIFTGPGEVLIGTADTLTNIHFADENQAKFLSEKIYDYQLIYPSPAINAGTDPGTGAGMSLFPQYIYKHPMLYDIRPTEYIIDIGAYEWLPLGVDDDLSLSSMSVYPNPAENIIYINVGVHNFEPLQVIRIYNAIGECVMIQEITQISETKIKIDISNLYPGVYFVRVGNETMIFVKE